MANVILFYPRTGMDISGTFRYVPLSVLTLAAPLVKEGYSVALIDQRLDPNWREKVRKEVDSNTICFGISSMTGLQLQFGLEAAMEFRKIAPKIPIVWGGAHPSLVWEQCLGNPYVDLVVVNEGDETFPRLVKSLEDKSALNTVAGIAYKEGGKARFTGMPRFVDLDSLRPLPYHLIPLNEYLTSSDTSEKSINIETSRGCPARCSFCYYGSSSMARWRYMSSEKILGMIHEILEKGIKGIWLYDSNFFASHRRVKDIVDGLSNAGIQATFKAQCRAEDLLHFDVDFLKKLRSVGFEKLFVGIESGSDRILKLINKKITINQAYEVDAKLREAGIVPFYSFMCGIPGETVDDIHASLTAMKVLAEKNPSAEIGHLSLCSPYPGTEIFEHCRKTGWEPPAKMEDWINNTWNSNETSWLESHVKKFAKKASILSYFMNYKMLVSYYPQLKAPVKFMVYLYCKIIKLRISAKFYQFMPEIPLLIFLRKKMYSA